MFNCDCCAADGPDDYAQAVSTMVPVQSQSTPVVLPVAIVVPNEEAIPSCIPPPTEEKRSPFIAPAPVPVQQTLTALKFKPEVVEWEVTVSKSGQEARPLGLALICHFGRVAVVQCVREGGLVDLFNKTNKDAQILAGDVLVRCNNTTNDTKKMIDLFKSENELKFFVRRVVKFQATISLLGGGGLGLKMDKDMIVTDVMDASVKEYNKNIAEPGYQVMLNDCIIAVDGNTGTSEELWAMIYPTIPSAAPSTTLTLHRK